MDWKLIKQAWLAAADNWMHCRYLSEDDWVYVVGADGKLGLCAFIISKINPSKERNFMLGRISQLEAYDAWFKWPLTLEGAKQRERFCRRESCIDWESIKSAWTTMAERWEFPIFAKGQAFSEDGCTGLCFQLTTPYFLKTLSELDAFVMYEQISKLPNYGNTVFKWALDASGAKSRFDFCIERAKELE